MGSRGRIRLAALLVTAGGVLALQLPNETEACIGGNCGEKVLCWSTLLCPSMTEQQKFYACRGSQPNGCSVFTWGCTGLQYCNNPNMTAALRCAYQKNIIT